MNSFYCFFQFINNILRLKNFKTRKAMNVKTLVFVICVATIIYLLLSNLHDCTFKACIRYFLSNFYFSPNDSPSKTKRCFFISSKKLFPFSRYSNFCISVFPSFFSCQPLLWRLIQEKS